GASVLEVGPGPHDGAVLVLVAYGMRPIVIDRFLSPWQREHHGPLYAALADELERSDPEADVSPLRALVAAGGYDGAVLARLGATLEALPLPTDSVDVVVSNAAVEHLSDLDAAFAQLYRVTRPGGLGIHQVDFRDHRDFGRPLEYLLLGEPEFQALFEE